MTSSPENPAHTETIEVVKDMASQDLLSNREAVMQTATEVATVVGMVNQEVAEEAKVAVEVAKVAAEDTVAVTMKTVAEEISKTVEVIVATEAVKTQAATITLKLQDVTVKTVIAEETVVTEATTEVAQLVVANQPTESCKLKNDKF
jgi:hypothetical protein